MKKVFFIVILCFFSFLAVAQRRFYTPQAYQISSYTQKDELHLSVGRGNGYDVNASYSFSNKFCLLFAYGFNPRYERRNTLFSGFGIKNDNNTVSARLGYFKKIRAIGFKRMEAYFGFSKTKIDNYWDYIESNPFQPEYAMYTKTAYNNIYIGTDIIANVKPMEFAISMRCNFYKYGSFQFHQYNPSTYYTLSTVADLRGVNGEMIFSMGGIYKKIKLCFQGGFSLPISSPLARQTDLHTTNAGTDTIIHREGFRTAAFISRISLQYNFYRRKKG